MGLSDYITLNPKKHKAHHEKYSKKTDYHRIIYENKRAKDRAKADARRTERARPKTAANVDTGVFDYSKLAKTLKQTQAVEGKAISPEIMKNLMSGTIEGQIDPAMAREERERDRQFKLDAEERARKDAEDAGLLGGVAAGAAIGSNFGGVGVVVGGVIGGVASMSVICTELCEQGLLDIKVIKKATLYRMKCMDREVYLGYLIWATPLVLLMQKSPFVTSIVKSFWIPLTYELAARTEGKKGNFVGKVALGILEPFSKIVYSLRGREVSYG